MRCNTKYLGAPSEYSTHTAYARRCDGYSPQPALNKGACLMTLCAPVFSLRRFQISGFRGNIYLPAPSPLPKSQISPISAFLSKLKPSLLACSTASSSATLLHAARPCLSREVSHTRPPSSSSFHIPHAPTAGATPSTQITDPSTK